MGLTFKTRLFAEEKKSVWTKTKDTAKEWGNKAAKYPKQAESWLYDKAEGKRAGSGKYALGAAGALLGGGLGAGIAGITLKGLKGRLRDAHPDWSDEKIDAEYNKIKRKRLAIGGALGAVAGGVGAGYRGFQRGKGGNATAALSASSSNPQNYHPGINR